MTPLLIVALPDGQTPIVWWASDHYIVSATSRLDETLVLGLPFDEACRRYAELHGEAHFFETQEAALEWAESYLGAAVSASSRGDCPGRQCPANGA